MEVVHKSFFVHACLALFPHLSGCSGAFVICAKALLLDWARAQINPAVAEVSWTKRVEENFLRQIEHTRFALCRFPRMVALIASLIPFT